jgi:hypothetical protein
MAARRELRFLVQVVRANLKRGTAMKTLATIIAIASALFLAQAGSVLAQSPGGPGQAPPGGTTQSTMPPGNQGPAATSSSGTVGQSGRYAQPQEPTTRLKDPKEDPVVRETEQEVSKRIKNICKGC